ncbi:MAG: hypothetical protein EOP00_13025 [Pedobacter sp.]|nr:MAG: hypothetical protein EOP00_13025 [Pedobacter sp.]
MNEGLNAGLNGCGWICRQLNKISNAVSKIPFLGTTVVKFIVEVQKVVDLFDNDLGALMRPALSFNVSEPTKAEETILDNWVNNKFTPFFTDMVVLIDAAFATNNLQTQITVANKQLLKMKVVREYYVLNETTGLSQNAVNLRMNLINELFNTLDQVIVSKLGSATTATLVTANQSDFGNLFVNTVQGQKYSTNQYGQSSITTVVNEPVNTTPTKTVTNFDEPVKVIPTKTVTNFDAPVKVTDEILPVFQDSSTKDQFVSEDLTKEEEELSEEEPSNSSSFNYDKAFKFMSYALIGVSFIGLLKSLSKSK